MRLMSSRSIRVETNRATKYLVGQIRKGWTIQEAMEQMQNNYGHLVYTQVIHDLKHFYEKSN